MSYPKFEENLSRRSECAWSLVVASNDEAVLQDTLLSSPAIGSDCQVIVKRGFSSAAYAYNEGLDEAHSDIVIFAHQDVYLPDDWFANLRRAIEQLRCSSTQWGVLGSFGVAMGSASELRGYCYSTGLRRILGEPFFEPLPAHTLDELVLVVRRSSGLRFDPQLPGFHLYGADICMEAILRSMGCFIVPAFCVHNANGVTRLPHDFWRAYLYLRRKWRAHLPIATCCTTITARCLPMAHRLAVECKERFRPRHAGRRCADVASLYEELRRTHPEICAIFAA